MIPVSYFIETTRILRSFLNTPFSLMTMIIVMMMMVSAFHQKVNRCPVILLVCCSSSFLVPFLLCEEEYFGKNTAPFGFLSCPYNFLNCFNYRGRQKVWFGGKKEQETTHGTANVKTNLVCPFEVHVGTSRFLSEALYDMCVSYVVVFVRSYVCFSAE